LLEKTEETTKYKSAALMEEDNMERAQLSVGWLEQATIERNWTQEYVADHMNVPIRTIQRWKSGKHQPQPRQFYRLCKLFQRPLPPGFPVENTVPEERTETQTATREERQASLVISPPEAEDTCTRFLASDLTRRLDRIIRVWSLRNVHARYHELQALLIQELEQKDNTMQESSINRRNALRRIAALPIEMYSLSFAVPALLSAPEEFLPRCAAGITACWYLSKGKNLAFVFDAVSRYVPTLKEMATNGKGAQRRDAAELLAQCLLLKALCVTHTSADHMASLDYAKQAETYGKLAGIPMFAIVAVRQQASAYDYADDWEQAVSTAERARNMMDTANKGKTADNAPVPSFVQSFVHIGLANYQAHCGEEQEALTSLRLAEDTFLASKNEPTPPVWTVHNEANLYLMGGLAYYHLDNQAAAITSFAKIDALADRSETSRIESFTDQVMAEVNRSDKPRDMEFCIENWQNGIQGAFAMRSQQAFTEARTAYTVMRAAWPGEQRVKKLGEQMKHW